MLDKGYGLNNYVTEAGIGATRVWNNTAVKPDPANPDQTVGSILQHPSRRHVLP